MGKWTGVGFCVALLLGACSQPTENIEMDAAQAGVDAAMRGQELYAEKCSECHNPRRIGRYRDRDWENLVRRMIEEEEAEITDDEARLITGHLNATFPPDE
jgi:mono/diheme cytochrome c family protein